MPSGRKEKLHLKAHHMALSAQSPLPCDEREFIFSNWSPAASALAHQSASFFTPLDLAIAFAQFSIDDGYRKTIVDLCAGIGVLTYAAIFYSGFSVRTDIDRIICVEKSPEHVKIGKKVMPEAEWYCADIFDKTFWNQFPEGTFNTCISNPPFIRIPQDAYTSQCQWLSYFGKSDLMAAEVALKVCGGATMILPSNSLPFEYSGKPQYKIRHDDQCKDYLKWRNALEGHGKISLLVSCETTDYKFTGATPSIEMCSVDHVMA